MKLIRLFALALAGKLVVANSFAQFADAVVAYTPGVGVSTSYTNPVSALGQPSRITPGMFGGPVDPFNSAYLGSQLVSVGAGGSLTLEFNTPISNNPANPFGLDFIIFGNAGFTITNGNYSGGGITDGSMYGNNAGSTRVSVSADGVTFYALDPALAPTVDTLFPTDGAGNFFQPMNPSLTSASFGGQGLAGIAARYAGSGGGAGYDLAWAQDTNGTPMTLNSVRFVRVDVLSGKSEVDGMAAVSPSALTMTQDFSSNPLAHGWKLFGDASLLQWNAANQNLQVTWDSSRSNSYLQLPLGTIISRYDDFRVELDLVLNDFQGGINLTKPGPMQLAFGFQNRADAESTNFNRGTGANSPNLVEFNFFPDTGFGPTVWPAVISTNSEFNYNGSGDFQLFDLPVGVAMRIVLAYTASNQTITTSIRTNGVLVGPVASAQIGSTFGGTPFTQFKVDTLAISSYSDLGLAPGPYAGSLLAHGVIDNLVVTFPPPPIQHGQSGLTAGEWQHSFISRTNWNYTLQATTNFQSWINVDAPRAGTGGQLQLNDASAGSFNARFYRISTTPNF
ncbi:MAG: hypothetical protein L0Z50_00510 [Verrucomicrobiales bacterium]|nr:hypothetical protein [Verrucomicrobiales bacterium]